MIGKGKGGFCGGLDGAWPFVCGGAEGLDQPAAIEARLSWVPPLVFGLVFEAGIEEGRLHLAVETRDKFGHGNAFINKTVSPLLQRGILINI